jgi:hypothetical protein
MDLAMVRAKVLSDSTGAITEIPILVTGDGPLSSLVDYLLWRRHDRSLAWMRKVVQDVRLLLTYMRSNAEHFPDPESLFHNFIQRLYTGTIGPDGLDPSGLYWKPYNHRIIGNILTRLTDFSNWIAERQGTLSVNPLRTSSHYDEFIAAAAWMSRKNRAFLGHTWKSTSAGNARLARSTLAKRSPKVNGNDAIAFPEKHFSDLLFHGFVRRGGEGSSNPARRLQLRDCLITLLMHGAGFRLSECFHLWICDVQPHPNDPTVAWVRIHHPSLGDAPGDWLDERENPIKCNRSGYLAGRYALRPRTELISKHYAGWKDPSLDGKYYMEAYWFQTSLGRLFFHLWKLYLREIVDIPRFHPYAFIVEQGETAGSIYCLDNYKQAHARTVRRIGLFPSKAEGTTPHGHRHAYGRRLMRAGVPPVFRQIALHHKSPSSQVIYTTPNHMDVSKALDAATLTLNTLAAEGRHVKPEFDMEKLLAYGFEDVDPDGLWSGPAPKLGYSYGA